MRSTNPQILKNQILRCVTQSESTRVDRDRNPGSNPGWCKKKGGACCARELIQSSHMRIDLIIVESIRSTRVGRAREWSATTMRSCKSLADSVAQLVARGTTNLEIAGSNPVGDIFRFQTKIEFYILLRSSQILMVTRICNHDEMLHIISKKKKASRST